MNELEEKADDGLLSSRIRNTGDCNMVYKQEGHGEASDMIHTMKLCDIRVK